MFAGFAWSSTSLSSLGLAGLLIAFLFQPLAFRDLRREPLFWLFVIASGYLMMRTLWAIWEFPASASDQLEQAWSWFRLWLFLPVAWWIGGRLERINLVLLLALASLFTSAALHLDWSRFPGILMETGRQVFHRHPNPFALYVATALLGLLMLAPRWWGSRRKLAAFAMRGLLWWLAVLLLIQWLISTQTRGAWLGVLIVFPIALGLRLTVWLREHPQRRAVRLGVAAVGIVVLAGIVAARFPVIENRILQDQDTYAHIATGDLQHLPVSSTSWRLHLYRFALNKAAERPVFGWGPGTTEWLIRTSGRQELLHPTYRRTLDWLDHLHSTYLELLVRYGLVGLVIAGWGMTIMLQSLWRAYRTGRLPPDYALFVAGSFSLMAIWSAFDYRLDHFDWRHYSILLAGVTYSFDFSRKWSPARE